MKLTIKLFSTALALVAVMTSNSCSNPDKVSSMSIVKQVNAQMRKNAGTDYFATVKVGTYECNDAYSRLELRQMEAAGLVNYSVKRYPWWEKSKKTVTESYEVTHNSYYWGPYTTTEYRTVKKDKYDFEDHYVVEISLTKRGEKDVVAEYPQAEPDIDKDLRDPEVDPSSYAWNKVDLSEPWPDIPNPFIQKEQKPVSNSTTRSSSAVRSSSSQSKTPYVERIDSLNYIAFNKLSLNPTEEIVKVCSIKAIKARNIQIVVDEGIRKARAEVILSRYNVTDFGRILRRVENNERHEIDVTLTYYVDKGWVLDK